MAKSSTPQFQFRGSISASKSLLNRLLVLQSFSNGQLQIKGDSSCDDVVQMRTGLASLLGSQNGLKVTQPIDCGAAGTTFRFLCLRASRLPGRHLLTGTARLLSRPQAEIANILRQLGVEVSPASQGLIIQGEGWQPPKGGALRVDRSQSSQFASAVLLNSWGLDFDLPIRFEGGYLPGGGILSQGYWDMTCRLVESAGMELDVSSSLTIPRHSQVRARRLEAEADVSSCFAVAALAAVQAEGMAIIENFPANSVQPDRVFPEILRSMGVRVQLEGAVLEVHGPERLRPVDVDLGDCPDLFPVLAVLCAFADGHSRLHGAPHLAHKESDRIARVAELVTRLGRRIDLRADGLEIFGAPSESVRAAERWSFDSSDDHRMAMAAAVARMAGIGIGVTDPDVVNKSFPEFWSIFERGGGVR